LQKQGIVSTWRQLRRLQTHQGFPSGYLLSPNVRVWEIEEVELWLANRRATISDERLAEIAAIPDDKIDTSDIPEATEADFARARRREVQNIRDLLVYVIGQELDRAGRDVVRQRYPTLDEGEATVAWVLDGLTIRSLETLAKLRRDQGWTDE
jgi:hypothetical protein